MEIDNPKPTKPKRGQKKVAEKPAMEEVSSDTGEQITKRRRKTPEDKGN